MTQAAAERETIPDLAQARSALEEAIKRDSRWRAECESLTAVLTSLAEQERDILDDTRGNMVSRSTKLGQIRASLELLRSDLAQLESKHDLDLAAWRETLSATLKIYQTHLGRALDVRKRQALECFENAIDLGILAAIRARMLHRNNSDILVDELPELIAQDRTVQELVRTRPFHGAWPDPIAELSRGAIKPERLAQISKEVLTSIRVLEEKGES
jgi:hypothetical protein